jgi:hypothetical protein
MIILSFLFFPKLPKTQDWSPEVPQFVGLFHAYTRGFNQDSRQHKLFIVTSGGCNTICDNYFNMCLDVNEDMSAVDICNSTETWYAKKANERNNTRIIYDIANAFNLNINTINDSHSYDNISTAACTTDTIHSDIFVQKDGMVSVLNNCVDTTRSNNGIMCNLHPSEGVWLFKGPLKTNSAMTHYGDSFGSEQLQTSFPTATHIINGSYSWKSNSKFETCNRSMGKTTSKDSDSVARINSQGEICARDSSTYHYTCIDESMMASLQLSKWKRDNGVAELIPIAVIHQEQE